MKRMITVVTLCFLAVCGWFSGAQGQTSYPMVCNGGGDMQVTVYQSYVPTANDIVVQVQITFMPAPQAASRQQPPPGTCAWIDRPLNAQERPDSRLFVSWRGKDVGVEEITVHQGRWSAPIDRIRMGGVKYLLDAVYNGKLFYLRCAHDNRNHWFTIIGYGP